MTYQIIIAGTGGQGVVISGILLAQAGLLSGLHAAQSGSYSAQVRGAFTRADVVLSEVPIDYPYVAEADALICLSPEGFLNTVGAKNFSPLRPGGLLLVDSTVITSVDSEKVKAGDIVDIPATRIATDLGKPQAANMVLLGAFLKKTAIFAEEKLRESVSVVLKGKNLDVNLACIQKGLEAAV